MICVYFVSFSFKSESSSGDGNCEVKMRSPIKSMVEVKEIEKWISENIKDSEGNKIAAVVTNWIPLSKTVCEVENENE